MIGQRLHPFGLGWPFRSEVDVKSHNLPRRPAKVRRLLAGLVRQSELIQGENFAVPRVH